MGSSTRRIDAQLEAATARWGKTECYDVGAVPDSSGSLNDTYFEFQTIDSEFATSDYYIWYNINSLGTDPALVGKTGIEVAAATDATANDIAVATKAAVDASSSEVFVSVDSNSMQFENQVQGSVADASDTGSTGFSFATVRAGLSVDLGATSGAIELALSTEVVDITSNQTGSLIGSQIYTGSTAELSLALIEVTKERFDVLVGEVTGDSVTPGGGTKVSGYGESRLFQALDELGGQLILHPIRLPGSDKSSDVVFWKSAPKPESLNFDGTAPQELSVSFTAYLDQGYDTAINLFSKGDWTQKGLRA